MKSSRVFINFNNEIQSFWHIYDFLQFGLCSNAPCGSNQNLFLVNAIQLDAMHPRKKKKVIYKAQTNGPHGKWQYVYMSSMNHYSKCICFSLFRITSWRINTNEHFCVLQLRFSSNLLI